MGHFSEQKNHLFLVEVFSHVLKKNPKAKLVLIGEGAGRQSVEKKCYELGIEKAVIFLGVRNDVNRILNSFDVFCFPSRYEGLPVSLIEAQSIGIPCVYADTITKEVNILNKQNVVLSLNEAFDRWSDAIISIKNRYEDPQRVLRESGYDIKIEAQKIADYYLSS